SNWLPVHWKKPPLPSKTSTGPVIPCRAARAQNTPLRESLAEVAAFQLEICPLRLRFREICDETAMPMAWRIWVRLRPNRRGAGAPLDARPAPASADAMGGALRQAQEYVIGHHGAQDHALTVTASGLHRRQHRGDGVAGVAAAMGVAVVVVVQVPGHHAIGKG